MAAATAVYGLVSFVLMGLCGLAVGWGIHRGAGDALAALALLVAFQFAATWVGIYLGLVIGNEQTAQVVPPGENPGKTDPGARLDVPARRARRRSRIRPQRH